MARRALSIVAATFAVAAAALVPSCSTRELACPDFDGCDANTECPLVRCLCGSTPVTSPPTCRADGTCTTTLDCAEVCGSMGPCAKPPASCAAFVPTECLCGDAAPRFAAAWDCETGKAEVTSAKDCADACAAGDPSGTSSSSAGSSGSLSSTGSSL